MRYIGIFLATWLALATVFPETTGMAAHRWFNHLKIGWESVQ